MLSQRASPQPTHFLLFSLFRAPHLPHTPSSFVIPDSPSGSSETGAGAVSATEAIGLQRSPQEIPGIDADTQTRPQLRPTTRRRPDLHPRPSPSPRHRQSLESRLPLPRLPRLPTRQPGKATANVKGHWFLPGGGLETCPVAVTRSARWWPWDLPLGGCWPSTSVEACG